MDRHTRVRNASLLAIAAAFTIAFAIIVIPPLASREHFDVIGALGKGFVNPFASGYALDIFGAGSALVVWIVYEAVVLEVKRGWIAIVLSFVPGITVGLVAYLLIRDGQVITSRAPATTPT